MVLTRRQTAGLLAPLVASSGTLPGLKSATAASTPSALPFIGLGTCCDDADTAERLVLAGLEAVDLVVPFAESTPISLIEHVRPDVLCKGEDYATKVVVGRELVEGYGGRVELVELLPGVSTTNIIARITES